MLKNEWHCILFSHYFSYFLFCMAFPQSVILIFVIFTTGKG